MRLLGFIAIFITFLLTGCVCPSQPQLVVVVNPVKDAVKSQHKNDSSATESKSGQPVSVVAHEDQVSSKGSSPDPDDSAF